jgi:predicted ATP-grasp superfamily ATP-dependent carboligase
VDAGGAGEPDAGLLAPLRPLGSEHPVLLPTSDRMVAFMHRNESALAEAFSFCLPGRRLAETLNDKHAETRLIASLASPCRGPSRTCLPAPWDLERVLGLPLIIKARSSVHKPVLGRANVVATTREQLEAFYQKHAASLAGVLAQEVIPGADDTLWLCSGVFNRRQPARPGAREAQAEDVAAALRRVQPGRERREPRRPGPGATPWRSGWATRVTPRSSSSGTTGTGSTST